MFATLAGGLPRPPSPASTPAGAAAGAEPSARDVAAAVALQVELGLELVSDGDLRIGEPVAATALGLAGIEAGPDGAPRLASSALPTWSGPIFVEAWRATAALTDLAVKQVVAGPYTLGRRLAQEAPDRSEVLTTAVAEALNAELRALAAAGCPVVQVDEPAAAGIGDSPTEAARFRDAQERLLDGIEGLHVSLAVTGGNHDVAGPATFFDPPYASYLFDLIDGPDDWRLIARAPTERGIVCGVVPAGDQPEVEKEVIVWAAHYAASTMGRGMARVGLSTSGSLAGVTWAEARRRLELLTLAARIAVEPPRRMIEQLDPMAFKGAPRPPRRP